jgi:excisionase family DNA binding protein
VDGSKAAPLVTAHEHVEQAPVLTAQEVADLYLRTTRKAVYALVQKGQVPGALRIGRRLLFRRDMLLAWISKQTIRTPLFDACERAQDDSRCGRKR